jgi:hypothetical protein
MLQLVSPMDKLGENCVPAAPGAPYQRIPIVLGAPWVGLGPHTVMACNFTAIVLATNVVFVTVHIPPAIIRICASDICPAEQAVVTTWNRKVRRLVVVGR